MIYFKEVSGKLYVAHDWLNNLIDKPQYIKLKFQCEPIMVRWRVEEFEAGNQKFNVKLQNEQFMTVLSVRLSSVERPSLEDKNMNVHLNTFSRLKLDTIASEEGEGGMEDDYSDI